MIFSLHEAVKAWEPENFDGEDIFTPGDLDLNREGRVFSGPFAKNSKLYHGHTAIGMGLSYPANILKEKYNLGAVQKRSIIRNNKTKMHKALLKDENLALRDVDTLFIRLCDYLLLSEKDKKSFPLFEAIVEILLAGGLPVAWKGEFLTPFDSKEGKYQFLKGSFVVYWPYLEDPSFSSNTCKVI